VAVVVAVATAAAATSNAVAAVAVVTPPFLSPHRAIALTNSFSLWFLSSPQATSLST
jgi:hypothetical protein